MKNIAVVCGGDSGEYEISMKSGRVVLANLNREKYKGFLVLISKRKWVVLFENGEEAAIDKNDFSFIYKDSKIVFDAVFNAIHGYPGENGLLTAYFDLLNIPYTSSGHTTSALTFHKDFCKRVVQSHGFRVAKSVLINKDESFDASQIISFLGGLPVFVKPNNGGSSVGITKVKKLEDFQKAVQTALKEDHQAMAETYVQGREIACGVMEINNRMIVFPLTEIVSKNEFFDYEAKYTKGMADEITPAPISEEDELWIKTTGAQLYPLLECKGFVRFDFILTADELYFIEVNIVPGISEASILPQQAEFMGISLSKLFEMALENIMS
ncbi:MAG: D-alanine--D-alanine ligase [Bacteroidales bacterium]|jgi:D-alanine-D-alanine ligase|nr:D-alanine--D-alanine ligase [Bacteroidales bacterium]HOI31906.1 D-alanine--D-alanine ligase [Bacteroidales bacterium]